MTASLAGRTFANKSRTPDRSGKDDPGGARLRADAVVGIDIDYETIGANGSMFMLSASGAALRVFGESSG